MTKTATLPELTEDELKLLGRALVNTRVPTVGRNHHLQVLRRLRTKVANALDEIGRASA